MEVRGLIFYSYGNNGDVHYSRNFVKHLSTLLPITQEYRIKCSPTILKDITNIKINPFDLGDYIQNEIVYLQDKKILLINTWIGSSNAKFILNEVGCSLTANYEKYQNIYRDLGLQIESPSYYVPEINWSVCKTDTVDEFFSKNNFKKKVLISNGSVLSGQSANFYLNPIIENLADTHKEVCFILTDSQNKISKPNVFYTSDIINVEGSDLNEIAYIGTKSDIIVGRGSGPFCFCHNQTTLFDSSKTFIALTNYKTDGWWALPNQLPPQQAKQLWSNVFDNDSIYSIIHEEIKQ
jgi:hypothetical protein